MSEVADAVKTLTKALKEDEGFYYAYQANIAVAFQDEAYRQGLDVPVKKMHEISNQAAKNFLDLWIRN